MIDPTIYLAEDPVIATIIIVFFLLSAMYQVIQLKTITSRGQLLFLVSSLLVSIIFSMMDIQSGRFSIAVPGLLLAGITLYKLLMSKMHIKE